jgi:hypothetical protein
LPQAWVNTPYFWIAFINQLDHEIIIQLIFSEFLSDLLSEKSCFDGMGFSHLSHLLRHNGNDEKTSLPRCIILLGTSPGGLPALYGTVGHCISDAGDQRHSITLSKRGNTGHFDNYRKSTDRRN